MTFSSSQCYVCLGNQETDKGGGSKCKLSNSSILGNQGETKSETIQILCEHHAFVIALDSRGCLQSKFVKTEFP